ncbi:hypothetical protein A1O3_05850 [Capronia epimyces CBS 606.96]|uniref:Uncharacterized protein n=1 Tax=Capronia epimyces CBS 606.96 TaxID=1182542 RepID=W9Y6B0_9EURO|nr:uncharacterized protein A1O3_05850 [Capronia epimyces CBS 606.96]EXJ85175.1 hypothetical protein A1O3_05850 [Capronia epimyces CBS 606.96]
MALPEPFPEAGDTMLFEMHLTAHPVVLPHLEEFMRLSRLRDFPAAITLFNDQLLEHIDDAFLVVIECADLLFEQGNYGELSRFLETRLSTKTPTEGESAPQRPEAEEELELLLVMKSLAKIFTKGALRPALVQARRCRDYLARVTTGHQEKAGQPPTSTQIYMFEIYLGIVVFAFETSNWVELSHLDPPWIPATSGGRGALHWFKTLQDKGYLWEAWRVLRILLPVLPKLPSHDVAQLIFGEESQQDRSEKGSVAVDEKKEEDRKLGWREGDLEVELEQFNYGLIDEHLHPETRSLRAGPDRRFTRQLEEMGDLRMWAATWIQGLLVQMDELGDQALLPLDQIYDVLDQIDYDVRRQDYHFESGDSIGSLRMWELLATILLTLSAQGNTDKFAQPLLASATEAFETSILVKKLKSDMSRRRLFYIRIGEILSKIRHPVSIYNFARQISYHEDSEEEYPTEFDVPLCIWAVVQTTTRLSTSFGENWPLRNRYIQKYRRGRGQKVFAGLRQGCTAVGHTQ